MVKELFGILGILIVLFEIYRYLRKYWICRLLEKKKKEKRTRKPAVLRPKSERGKLPRLPFLSRGKGETNSSDARNACILAVAEGTGRAKKEDAHRRVLLPEQRLRVLRDHGRGDPCVGGVWDAWNTTWLKGIAWFGIVTGLVESFTIVTGIEPVAISAAVGKGASGRTLAVFKPVAGANSVTSNNAQDLLVISHPILALPYSIDLLVWGGIGMVAAAMFGWTTRR